MGCVLPLSSMLCSLAPFECIRGEVTGKRGACEEGEKWLDY